MNRNPVMNEEDRKGYNAPTTDVQGGTDKPAEKPAAPKKPVAKKAAKK